MVIILIFIQDLAIISLNVLEIIIPDVLKEFINVLLVGVMNVLMVAFLSCFLSLMAYVLIIIYALVVSFHAPKACALKDEACAQVTYVPFLAYVQELFIPLHVQEGFQA